MRGWVPGGLTLERDGRWMWAYNSSDTRRSTSMAARGFWVEAALSREPSGLSGTVHARIGKSARTRVTLAERHLRRV